MSGQDSHDRPLVEVHDMEIVGGHPALDCINTVHTWSGDRPGRDYLRDYTDLVAWHLRMELLDEHQAALFRAVKPRAGSVVLGQFRELRRVLHGIFRTLALGLPVSTSGLAGLDRVLYRTQSCRRLVQRADTVIFEWDFRNAPVSALLGPVAWQAAELLTGGPLDRVKECPLPDGCGWIFLDTSRNRSRHWCNMKTCGNLAKVRRFRARQG